MQMKLVNFRSGFIAVVLAHGVATPSLANGDAAAGEKVFKRCRACHQVGEGAKNRIGPHLNGVVGRIVAAEEGFKYSDAFVALSAEGMVWSEENLSKFLAKPKDFIPGTMMVFGGLKKEDDIANLIAYLGTN